jgi:SOS-response transcriptional repressor LexA
MAFAKSADHLDADPIALADLLAPRPAASVIYRVKDRGMEAEGIRPGDILILERAQPLRAGQIALVSVDGGSRLVRVEGHAGRFSFAGMPSDDATVEHLATVSRILRILLP